MDPRITRRSARLQEAQRPSYPHMQPTPGFQQSTSSSAFNSSSSLSSMSNISSGMNSNLSQSPDMDQHPRFSAAPLPSPSQQTQQSHYFAPTQAGQESQAQQQQFQQQQYQQQQQQQFFQQQNGQLAGKGGNAGETQPFLSNFSLIAEAAKRAQMACLMRDFGDVEL